VHYTCPLGPRVETQLDCFLLLYVLNHDFQTLLQLLRYNPIEESERVSQQKVVGCTLFVLKLLFWPILFVLFCNEKLFFFDGNVRVVPLRGQDVILLKVMVSRLVIIVDTEYHTIVSLVLMVIHLLLLLFSGFAVFPVFCLLGKLDDVTDVAVSHF